MKNILTSLLILSYSFANAVTWHVGALQAHTTPSAIVNLVQNGDTIKIDAGVYLNDPVQWNNSNLVFIGLGTGSNRTVMSWNGGDISNGKGIWVFGNSSTTGNITIDNIVFDGARVSDANGGNGAGIRFQAKNLTITNCLFHSCQNGILEGGSYTGSVVTIQNTEFNNNGYEVIGNPTYSGYEHNIYIGASTDSLLVKNCYFHDPRGEANSLKTRAQKSYILYNVIDEANGQGSWELSIGQGGLIAAIGNTIVQGINSINHGIVGYDAATNPIQKFYFINNTVINKYHGGYTFFNIVPSSGITVFKVYNNIFSSVSAGTMNTLISGTLGAALDTMSNKIIADYTTIGFVNAAANDFHLTSSAVSVIDHSSAQGTASSGFVLKPVYQYVNFASPLAVRTTAGLHDDIGAFEYGITTGINNETDSKNIVLYPNPASNYFTLELTGKIKYDEAQLIIYDITGREVKKVLVQTGKTVINIKDDLTAGTYIYSILNTSGQPLGSGKLIVQ